MVKYIDKLVIDKDLNWTPARHISKKKLRFTNHNAIIFKLKNLPKKSSKKNGTKPIIWNTKKQGGWELYNKSTEENEKMKEIVKEDSDDVNAMMHKISKELNKVKYKAFGKVKVSKGSERS